MATVASAPVDLANVTGLSMHRFTVEEYHRMIETGIVNEDDRVELLQGWIVTKMPHNPPHDGMIDIVIGELTPCLPPLRYPRVQSAITTEDSEPEPDIAVVRGPRGRYKKAHPRPADIGLLIEVAESTLSQDRNFKAALYAQAGIAPYWIVNLVDHCVEVYTAPSGPGPQPGYQQIRKYSRAESIPVILDGQEIGQISVGRLFDDEAPAKNGEAGS